MSDNILLMERLDFGEDKYISPERNICVWTVQPSLSCRSLLSATGRFYFSISTDMTVSYKGGGIISGLRLKKPDGPNVYLNSFTEIDR